MKRDLSKPAAIEPEILDEHGRQINPPKKRRAQKGRLSAVAGLIGIVTAFVLMAGLIIILAVPMLIMALFGKKVNFRIFRYKL